MRTIVYCVGTATEVGKTFVGAAVLRELRARGRTVAARKPVQSLDPAGDGPTDAEVLAAATGEAVQDVCRADWTYEVPLAPPMAADVLGRACPTIEEVVADLRVAGDLVWIEGVGGPRSPLAIDGDGVDLCGALGPDRVVLVADAGLGTINAVALSVPPFVGHRPIVVLNRYDHGDDLHRRNRRWLVERLGLDVVVDPAAVCDRL